MGAFRIFNWLVWCCFVMKELSAMKVQPCHENPCHNGGQCYKASDALQNTMCPQGFTPFEGKCYMFGRNLLTWEDAKNHCEQTFRASLLSIESQEERIYIQQFLEQQLNLNNGAHATNDGTQRQMDIWTAGRLEGDTGNPLQGRFFWKTLTGSHPVSLGLWEPGQPGEALVADACIVVGAASSYTNWEIQNCGLAQNYYVCEMDEPQQNEANGNYYYQCRCPDGYVGASCELRRPDLTQPSQLAVCEHEPLDYACPRGYDGNMLSIVVDYANYGQPTIHSPPNCPIAKPNEFQCVAPNSLMLLTQRCQGLPECHLPALSSVFTENPCLPDASVYLEYRFRCEDAKSGDQKCPIGSELFEGRCYQVVFALNRDARKSWKDAQTDCQSRGGDLVAPIDQKVHEYLEPRLKQKGDNQQVKQFWIGLKISVGDQDVIGRWINGDVMTFQPNGTRFDSGYTCAQYYVQLGKGQRDDVVTWVGKNCDQLFNWICQFPPFPGGHARKQLYDPRWNMSISSTTSLGPLFTVASVESYLIMRVYDVLRKLTVSVRLPVRFASMHFSTTIPTTIDITTTVTTTRTSTVQSPAPTTTTVAEQSDVITHADTQQTLTTADRSQWYVSFMTPEPTPIAVNKFLPLQPVDSAPPTNRDVVPLPFAVLPASTSTINWFLPSTPEPPVTKILLPEPTTSFSGDWTYPPPPVTKILLPEPTSLSGDWTYPPPPSNIAKVETTHASPPSWTFASHPPHLFPETSRLAVEVEVAPMRTEEMMTRIANSPRSSIQRSETTSPRPNWQSMFTIPTSTHLPDLWSSSSTTKPWRWQPNQITDSSTTPGPTTIRIPFRTTPLVNSTVQPVSTTPYSTSTPRPRRTDPSAPFLGTTTSTDAAYCAARIARGLSFARTKEGDTAMVACPSGLDGVARWLCKRDGLSVDFYPDMPDLSGCKHPLMTQMEQQAAAGVVSADALAQSLGDFVHQMKGGMVGGDVVTSVDLIGQLVPRQRLLMLQDTSMSTESKGMRTTDFTKTLGSVTNVLLDNDVLHVWRQDIPKESRQNKVSQLMLSLENAGDLMSNYLERSTNRDFDYQNFMMSVHRTSNEPRFAASVEEAWPPRPQDDDQPKRSGLLDSASIRIPVTSLHSASTVPGSNSRISIVDPDVADDPRPDDLSMGYFLYSQGMSQLLEPDVFDKSAKNRSIVNSAIIGASVGTGGVMVYLPPGQEVQMTLQHIRTDRVSNARCVFWNLNNNQWDSFGCTVNKTTDSYTICSCNHLTSFAILMDVSGDTEELTELDKEILTWFSKLGCSISIACLALSVAVFSFFKSLYGTRNTIHRNLCFCLLVAEGFYLFGIDSYEEMTLCTVIAAFLHYFFLASFFWMLLEGYQLYLMLIKVFQQESKVWLYYVVAYGLPAVIVSISVGLRHEDYGTKTYCWIDVKSNTIWAFIGPVTLVIMMNIVFLIIALRVVFSSKMSARDKGKMTKIKGWLKGSTMLLCLLGITWVFGYFSVIPHFKEYVYFAYIFTVLNSLQGVFIFVFHVLLNEKVHGVIAKCCRRSCACCMLSQYDSVNSSSTGSHPRKGSTSSAQLYSTGSKSSNGSAGYPTVHNGDTVYDHTTVKSYNGGFLMADETPVADTGDLRLRVTAYDRELQGLPMQAHEYTDPAAGTLTSGLYNTEVNTTTCSSPNGHNDGHLCSKDCKDAKYLYDPRSLVKDLHSSGMRPPSACPRLSKEFLGHF